MAYIIADSVISPLGDSSMANFESVVGGCSALKSHSGKEFGLPEDFTASLLSREQCDALMVQVQDAGEQNFSHFEAKAFYCALRALYKAQQVSEKHPIDLKRTILILSSTKGEVELKGGRTVGENAKRIASALGLTTEAIAVSNACISGLSAMILAGRLLDQGTYDHAVVCGTDDVGPFVISGFQSLKAMSPRACRPFDLERMGLNLGEAAAAVVMSRQSVSREDWELYAGLVRNDACNLTSPSKTAEGQFRCLSGLLSSVHFDEEPDSIGFVNPHGTATFFNDQMESVALRRAGISHLPATALKGYFGHTLGAAGILETVMCMKAADNGLVPGTKGFERLGVSARMNLSPFHRPLGERKSFVKMLSGFGGCNAAVALRKCGVIHLENQAPGSAMEGNIADDKFELCCCHRVFVSPGVAVVDNESLVGGKRESSGFEFLSYLYKRFIVDYPRFHKMDRLSRLGFVASELLLQAECRERFTETEDRAVVLFNSCSSVHTDRRYMATYEDSNNCYPSPSLFIYTLPNVVIGEMTIRNHWHGETALYILSERNKTLEKEILEATCRDEGLNSVLTGWLDYVSDEDYIAELAIYEIKRT